MGAVHEEASRVLMMAQTAWHPRSRSQRQKEADDKAGAVVAVLRKLGEPTALRMPDTHTRPSLGGTPRGGCMAYLTGRRGAM